MQNKGPLVCTTANYLKNAILIAVPGNSEYASVTKNDCKGFAVNDSHVNQI